MLDKSPVMEGVSLKGEPVVIAVGELEHVRLSETQGLIRAVRCVGPPRESGGVRCTFRDAKAMADVVETRQLTPQLALASGAMTVSGDWRRLRAVSQLMAAAGRTVRVVEGRRRADGALTYCVIHGERRVERSFSEFEALRDALRRGGARTRTMFPFKFAPSCVSQRHKSLDAWLAAAVAGATSPAARRAIADFVGDDEKNDAPVLPEPTRSLEFEFVLCRVAASTIVVAANCAATLVSCMVYALPLWALLRGKFAVAAVGSAGAVAWKAEMGSRHVTRLVCCAVLAVVWRLAKRTTRMCFDDAGSGRFGLARKRHLPERLALRLIGEAVAAVAEAECGLLLKLGQFLATMRGLLATEITEPLARLADGCPPMSPRDLRWRLAGLSVCDAVCSSPPVASASIAQVHRVDCPDGRAAAVKCQKPGLHRIFAAELRSFRLLAAIAARAEPEAPDLRQTMRDAYDLHIRELDFLAEAHALDVARCLLQARGIDAVVPDVLRDLADPSSGVLAMSWCKGSKICVARHDGVELADGTRLDPPAVGRVAVALVESLAALFLLEGLAMMDPHGGNVLVDAYENEPRPVLLDFGMHELLPDDIRLAFARIFIATAADDALALQAALADMGVESTFTAHQSLLHFHFLLRESSCASDAEVVAIADFLDRQDADMKVAADKAKKAGVRLAKGFELFNSFLRQTDLLHGYVHSLPCTVNFLDIYAKWARIALDEATPPRG